MYELVSPYDDDADAEIRAFFPAGKAVLADVALEVARNEYELIDPEIARLHVGAGLAVTIVSAMGSHVFKLNAGKTALCHQERLVRLASLRRLGLPLPEVVPTKNGDLLWRDDALRMHGYLMRKVAASPPQSWNGDISKTTAEALAQFHALGQEAPRQPGQVVTLDDLWPDSLASVALLHGKMPAETLKSAEALIHEVSDFDGLSWTHVHGDPRLCHFLFEGQRLAGLIDHDDAGWGHRVGDAAHFAISHPDPANVAFLKAEEINEWLVYFHEASPMNDADLRVLRPAMAGLLLFETAQLACCLEQSQSLDGQGGFSRAGTLLAAILEGRVGL